MYDNYSLWERHDKNQNRRLEKYPVCCVCGEHIQDDFLYVIDNDLFCESCMDDYRQPTEKYMEGE